MNDNTALQFEDRFLQLRLFGLFAFRWRKSHRQASIGLSHSVDRIFSGFWIPIAEGIPDSLSCILDSNAQDSGCYVQNFPGFPYLWRISWHPSVSKDYGVAFWFEVLENRFAWLERQIREWQSLLTGITKFKYERRNKMNRIMAWWRHFPTTTRILQFVVFLRKLGLLLS